MGLGRLATTFSKVAGITGIAGLVAAAGLTEDPPDLHDANFDNHVQSGNDMPGPKVINGVPGRIQANPLPDFFLPNFMDLENTYRNPAYRQAVPQPYDSIGGVDTRIAITLGMREYNPVLQMADSHGRGFCTATITDIEGFHARGPGTIIVTAAHCFDIKDKDGNVIGQRSPEDVFFKGSYIDNQGAYEEISFRGDSVWINPLYEENVRADIAYFMEHGQPNDLISEADNAVIFSKQLTPQEITPAFAVTTSMKTSLELRDKIAEAKTQGINIGLTVVGHSGDKPYLTADPAAIIVNGDFDGINTTADIVPGASGGPVFFNKDGEIKKDEQGHPILVGINSTVSLGTDFARHSYLNSDALQMVPFLAPDGVENDEYCGQSGEVLVSDLNIRVEPDAGYQKLAPDEQFSSVPLQKGTLLDVHAMTQNSLGETWALVTSEFGRTGYVIADKGYIELEPKTCVHLKP